MEPLPNVEAQKSISLSDLPPEILEQILSYSSTTHKSVDLWRCGNRRLQHLLRRSVTQVELEDPKPFTYSYFPKMLLELRSLRSLALSRDYERLGRPFEVGKMLRQVSPSLQKLKINCAEAFSIFLASTSPISSHETQAVSNELSRVLPASSVLWSLSETFPSLTTLEIRGSVLLHLSDLVSLPDTLEKLVVEVYIEKWDFSDLPRGLLHLQMNPDGPVYDEDIPPSPEALRTLPPGLTYLDTSTICTHSCSMLEALPRSLRKIASFWTSWTSKTATIVPPALEQISISKLDIGNSVELLKMLPQSLIAIDFATTESFSLTSSILQILPSSVKSLIVRDIIWGDIKRSTWPQNMKLFHVKTASQPLDHSKCSVLPLTITSLIYLANNPGTPLIALSHLHLPKLQNLALKVFVSSDIHKDEVCEFPSSFSYPKSLESLTLSGWQGGSVLVGSNSDTEGAIAHPNISSVLHALPHQHRFTSFRLDSSNATLAISQFKFLPPTLTRLDIHRLIVDWDPKNATNLSYSGPIDYDEQEIFACWPRSLDKVFIGQAPFIRDPKAFKMLPPQIRALSFKSTLPLSSDLVIHLPSSITSIFINLKHINDEVIANLPKSITFMNLGTPDTTGLTRSAIDHLSPNISTYGIEFGYEIDFPLLLNQRAKYLGSEDVPRKRPETPRFPGLLF